MNTMKLSVAILTYNQENYIRQAIDSVLRQEVDFDYEIVVGDDASTDHTSEILREYARRFPGKINLLLNTENTGISRNYQRVLCACRGEYIALLEGDDYWIDNTKLQKSADFLDRHPDYGFVGGNSLRLYPNGKREYGSYNHIPVLSTEGKWKLCGDVFDYARIGPVTRTATICFRKSLVKSYLHMIGVGNDLVLQTVLAHSGKFATYQEVWAVYRQGGVSTDKHDERTLYYTRWLVENCRLQKKIFPAECDYDEDELADMEVYAKLKLALSHLRIKEATLLHSQIKSAVYQRKRCYRYTANVVMCLVTGLLMKIGVKRWRSLILSTLS